MNFFKVINMKYIYIYIYSFTNILRNVLSKNKNAVLTVFSIFL